MCMRIMRGLSVSLLLMFQKLTLTFFTVSEAQREALRAEKARQYEEAKQRIFAETHPSTSETKSSGTLPPVQSAPMLSVAVADAATVKQQSSVSKKRNRKKNSRGEVSSEGVSLSGAAKGVPTSTSECVSLL